MLAVASDYPGLQYVEGSVLESLAFTISLQDCLGTGSQTFSADALRSHDASGSRGLLFSCCQWYSKAGIVMEPDGSSEAEGLDP